jgi:hypothetical protein
MASASECWEASTLSVGSEGGMGFVQFCSDVVSRFPFVRALACREQDGYEVLRNVVGKEKYSEVF